jgi:hypothetical protein
MLVLTLDVVSSYWLLSTSEGAYPAYFGRYVTDSDERSQPSQLTVHNSVDLAAATTSKTATAAAAAAAAATATIEATTTC